MEEHSDDHSSIESALTKASEEDGARRKPRNEFAKNVMSKIITIKTGSHDAPYFVHWDLLQCHSDYFSACLSSKFKEGLTSEVCLSLDDEDVVPFGYYIEYLYGDWYDSDLPGQPAISVRDTPGIPIAKRGTTRLEVSCVDQAFIHVRVHLLAERFLFPALKVESLQRLMYVLFIAVKYPPREDSDSGDGLKDGFPDDDEGVDKYRESFTDPNDGSAKKGSLSPLIPADRMGELLSLVYENTPNRSISVPSTRTILDGIREVLAAYCAFFWKQFSASNEFMDALFDNRDIFGDVMAYHTAMTSHKQKLQMTKSWWKLEKSKGRGDREFVWDVLGRKRTS